MGSNFASYCCFHSDIALWGSEWWMRIKKSEEMSELWCWITEVNQIIGKDSCICVFVSACCFSAWPCGPVVAEAAAALRLRRGHLSAHTVTEGEDRHKQSDVELEENCHSFLGFLLLPSFFFIPLSHWSNTPPPLCLSPSFIRGVCFTYVGFTQSTL